MKPTETFKRGNRMYYITIFDDGLCHVVYRPINKKTGLPWQAPRTVSAAYDCHKMYNYNSGESESRTGKPNREDVFENGKWNSCSYYCSSYERALTFIPKE